MKRAPQILSLCALTPFVVACSGGGGGSDTVVVEHPSLIVRSEDYARLRARANTSPWKELADRARSFAETETFEIRPSTWETKTLLTDLCGALALAYVVDPDPMWVDKLDSTLRAWDGYYMPTAPPGSGTLVRWQQSAMVQSILALDVMAGAMGDEQRSELEQMLASMIGQWWSNLSQDGTTSTPGIVALWALYQGDRARFQQAKDLFLTRLNNELTPSGLYEAGGGYAWVRQAGDRISKYSLLDVLMFTGEEPGLFEDERLVTLHEWLYGGAITPRRTNLTFGDSDPTRPVEGLLGYMPAYRAASVSAEAGANAAWLLRDIEPRALLSNYVLMDMALATPTPPKSHVWGDGASFWEEGAEVDSLMGALWSPRAGGSHSHKDVNAVHLYAYGENVLRNSGYCGSGTGIDSEFDWTWVWNRARSNNTVLVDGVDHGGKIGGGVLEGFTATGFDYAVADAGPALVNGDHERSLFMVHGEANRPGYFVLLDEVQAAPGSLVQVLLHPDSASVVTETPSTEYEWSIQQFDTTPVSVSLFLATSPTSAQLLDGGLCAFDDKEYVGQYLEATHTADAAGEARVLTLVVPHDADHAQPILTRLDGGSAYSGAQLQFPDALDTVAESLGDAPIVIGSRSFQGRAVHYREGAELESYFVRTGRSFDDGSAQRTGFESEADVSVFVRGTQAFVQSQGARVIFYAPELVGETFTTDAGTLLGAGAGFVHIELAPGRFGFDLRTGEALL